MNGYVHFNEVLYEVIRFSFKENLFKCGKLSGIKQIKQIDKSLRFRLQYKRIVNIYFNI
jgi:hypothetical protein